MTVKVSLMGWAGLGSMGTERRSRSKDIRIGGRRGAHAVLAIGEMQRFE
jgi:hypothetical protein